jgi:hypothetical protein
MKMMILFNRFQKNLPSAPVADADGFWITHGQKSTALITLRDSFATQAEMEKRGQEILTEGHFTKVTYRLLPDGKSGAIILD